MSVQRPRLVARPVDQAATVQRRVIVSPGSRRGKPRSCLIANARTGEPAERTGRRAEPDHDRLSAHYEQYTGRWRQRWSSVCVFRSGPMRPHPRMVRQCHHDYRRGGYSPLGHQLRKGTKVPAPCRDVESNLKGPEEGSESKMVNRNTLSCRQGSVLLRMHHYIDQDFACPATEGPRGKNVAPAA